MIESNRARVKVGRDCMQVMSRWRAQVFTATEVQNDGYTKTTMARTDRTRPNRIRAAAGTARTRSNYEHRNACEHDQQHICERCIEYQHCDRSLGVRTGLASGTRTRELLRIALQVTELHHCRSACER